MQRKTYEEQGMETGDIDTEVLAILIVMTDTTAAFICAFMNPIIDRLDVLAK